MKTFLIFIFLFRAGCAFSQRNDTPDCSDADYKRILTEGDAFFLKGLLDSATLKYLALKNCRPDSSPVVELKLKNVRTAIDKQTSKSLSATTSYLISEAKKSFEKDDIRMAWRLIEVVLKKDSTNMEAIEMRDTLPLYGAKIILNGNRAEKVSPDSSFWAYTTSDSGGTNLYLLDLRVNLPAKKIGNSYHEIDFDGINYSPDSRFLIFTSRLEDSSEVLNLFEIEKDVLPKQVYSCRCKFYKSDFLFSPDNHFFTFTVGALLYIYDLNQHLPLRDYPISSSESAPNIEFSNDGRFLTFVSVSEEGNAIINILEINENNPPKVILINAVGRKYILRDNSVVLNNPLFFGKIINSKSYSQDNRFLVYVYENNNNKQFINIIDLYSDSPPRQFGNVYAEDIKFAFSPDSRFLFFVTINKKRKQVMNILDLSKNAPPKKYYNIYFGRLSEFLYSPDGKFLGIMRISKDKNHDFIKLSIINLESNTIQISIDNVSNLEKKQIVFSPDSRFVAFVISNKNAPKALNLLDLYGKIPLRQFPNPMFNDNQFREIYDTKSRYMAFLSSTKEDSVFLNVLDLYSDTLPKQFNNISLRRSLEGGFKYSPNGSKLVFLTEKDDGLMFNTIELDSTLNRRAFKCCNLDSFYYTKIAFSANSRFLSFESKEFSEGAEIQYFNLIDLIHYTHRRFSHVNYISFEDGLISNDRYLVFKRSYSNEVQLFDLQKGKIIRKIYHQFKVYDYKFINRNYILTRSINPNKNDNNIFKIYYLPLGVNYFRYYTMKEFLGLSQQEKAHYKIFD